LAAVSQLCLRALSPHRTSHCRVSVEARPEQSYPCEQIQANIARDRNTDAVLKDHGWRVLRFWEHEDPGLAARKVAAALAKRRERDEKARRS
jgi:G:T-mismatch repair DNA endonuclease (very short patch repair protein)